MSPPKKLYGLIGYPVKHSLSAKMHNADFAASRIPAEYRLFELEPSKLEAFLLNDIRIPDTQGDGFALYDIAGLNITIPHKIKAKEILERKYPLSFGKLALIDQYYVKLSGAINTINIENHQPVYYNTDAKGFLQSLELKDASGVWGLGFTTKDKSALVIGSGGAGRAVVAALSWKNSGIKNIYINDINESASELSRKHFFGKDLSREWVDYLKEKLEFIATKKIPQVIEKCELLVNASPVGMEEGDPSPINKDLLHKGLSVYDVVYNTETAMVKEAQAKGLRAVGGLGMLLYQGIAAFELWTGGKANEDVRRQALSEGVKKI